MKRICPVCKNEFEPKRKTQKYCSRDCRRQAKHEQDKKWRENNPTYYKLYMRNWRRNRKALQTLIK